jgi:type II secretory pathway pseudopilin PulG
MDMKICLSTVLDIGPRTSSSAAASGDPLASGGRLNPRAMPSSLRGGSLAVRGRQSGFTMVEIALSLGVIAIALVAIIGVMPTGLQVQRENREDTILNQDGRFFLEAIRSGARGSDHLTNHVLSITVSNSVGDLWIHTNTMGGRLHSGHTNSLVNGRAIVGYLSTNRYVVQNNRLITNYVHALVRSIAGPADGRSELWRVQEGGEPLPMAFNYLMSVEVTPLITLPPFLTNWNNPNLEPPEVVAYSNNWLRARNQAANFSELRLELQGPVFQRGLSLHVLGRPKTFRTVVSGVREVTDPEQLTLFQPDIYVQVVP